MKKGATKARPEHLARNEAVEFIVKSLTTAHDRGREVGGLFNAYEVALHYELFTAALGRNLLDTRQEEPLGAGRKCDLVLPLEGGAQLWVEVKQWWFLGDAFAGGGYVNLPKTKSWPVADWNKLSRARHSKQASRAVVLVRTFTEDKRPMANDWLDDSGMPEDEAHRHGPYKLAPCRYRQPQANWPDTHHLRRNTPKAHVRVGDIHVWTTPDLRAR